MHRTTQATVTLAVVVMLIAAATSPAAAQDDESSVLDEVVGEATGVAAEAIDAAQFSYGYAKAYVSEEVDSVFGNDSEPAWSASATAGGLRTRIDSNSSAYQTWLNDRLTAAEDQDTLQVRVENETAAETLFVTATVDNETYTDLAAVGDTTRTVDESCTLTGDAGANAVDELDQFYTDAVKPNENVSAAFTGRLAATYDGDIDCTFIES